MCGIYDLWVQGYNVDFLQWHPGCIVFTLQLIISTIEVQQQVHHLCWWELYWCHRYISGQGISPLIIITLFYTPSHADLPSSLRGSGMLHDTTETSRLTDTHGIQLLSVPISLDYWVCSCSNYQTRGWCVRSYKVAIPVQYCTMYSTNVMSEEVDQRGFQLRMAIWN